MGHCLRCESKTEQKINFNITGILKLVKKRKKSHKVVDVEKSGNIFRKKGMSTQATINFLYKRNEREETCLAIVRFFSNDAIPFNVARGEEFPIMCELIAKHGQGFMPVSYHKIRVKYLKKEIGLTMQESQVHHND